MESPMKAVVGENKTIFYVHPSALMQGTSALTARVTGPWSNIGQQTLDWTDFDEETLECVLKFCYGRQYDVPWQSSATKDESTVAERARSHAEHKSNMDPDRKELCDFVAVSHQKLSRHFVQFHEETGDFKVDLACNFAARVTVLQSSNACLATEGQRRNSEFNVLMDRFLYQGRQDSFCFIRYQQGLTSQYAPCYLGSQFLSFCLIYLLNQKDTGRHFKRRT
ncbi:unnamed protein product [Penicillium nalgiovense]|uniref:BTB domain-containing protein n=1 Tax=Penicillium nalgiovense TaxID=60175 RepID=A0A9W4HIY3_PENNA|nr:unnamed protein product [Penicillium nalgiovense]CAG7996010.1 unnamed protein product [Penicillium nalgiovense]CAG8026933.1 unnamed protein product [Penicillium nalgiovense]CAG8030181.1 unnamed protein product [Penicillium nalgiovense]CAG8045367.1 unnamed protein product [Penicillium nalgiovense]